MTTQTPQITLTTIRKAFITFVKAYNVSRPRLNTIESSTVGYLHQEMANQRWKGMSDEEAFKRHFKYLIKPLGDLSNSPLVKYKPWCDFNNQVFLYIQKQKKLEYLTLQIQRRVGKDALKFLRTILDTSDDTSEHIDDEFQTYIERWLSDPKGAILAYIPSISSKLIKEDEVVSFILINTKRNSFGAAVIDLIYTFPKYRNRGYACSLINYSNDSCKGTNMGFVHSGLLDDRVLCKMGIGEPRGYRIVKH